MADNKSLTADQRNALFEVLKTRFEENEKRHEGIAWPEVQARLEENEKALWSLSEMEQTGGEPDVVCLDEQEGSFVFFDCSAESPAGRRNLCYDQEALDARKRNKPAGSAQGMAASMGIELLDESQYRFLQDLGGFDLKTSSWIATPSEIRAHGGAIFCDRRYDHVFVYHNGAESYYSSRGFRSALKV